MLFKTVHKFNIHGEPA